MKEENKDIDQSTQSYYQQSQKISPIRALTQRYQQETYEGTTEYEQSKPSAVQTDQNIHQTLNDSPNKSVKFQNAQQQINIKIQNNPFGKLDVNNMRKEFKKIKQNMSNNKPKLDISQQIEEEYQENNNQQSKQKKDRVLEMQKLDKSLYSSYQSNNPNQSQIQSPQKVDRMFKSVNETKKEVLRKNQEKMEQLKEQKRQERRQKIMEESMIIGEKKTQRLLEEREKESVFKKLESSEFYPAVQEMYEDMHLQFNDIVLVKKVNLLKKDTLQNAIINSLLEKNQHINDLTLNESLFVKILRFILHAIKIRSFILIFLEWAWLITLLIVTALRVHHFDRDQIVEDAQIQNKEEEEIITGETIPILLFIQVFFWILCNLAFLVSVLKCRIPFSTFHIIFHIGEIILNIFTFALGMTVVYNNKNSSAAPIHFVFGLLDFLFSFISLLISKSINGYLKKFLILTNQYSAVEFQSTCC